jgi:lipid-A-disaccharide synthase-like uncharacterized protein
MVEELLQDVRFRSRRWILAAFVEGFSSLVVIAVVAAHIATFILGLDATAPPLMPVLWWWASVSGGVLSLYGMAKVGEMLALGKESA